MIKDFACKKQALFFFFGICNYHPIFEIVSRFFRRSKNLFGRRNVKICKDFFLRLKFLL